MSTHDCNDGACAACRRRSWLLSALSATLDYCASDRPRLSGLLALEDMALLDALAGGRRDELQAAYEAFADAKTAERTGVEAVCRHGEAFPLMLGSDPRLPSLLHVSGEVRLERIAGAPTVAIVGARRASDYGVEMARSLARGVAASGVTVVSALLDGIAGASLAGALEAGGPAIAVAGSGLGVVPAAGLRHLSGRLMRSGCAVSELPHDCPGRRWGAVAGERIVVGLAEMVVVVEAEESPAHLAHAQLAQLLGRGVAAMPGRVTSSLSRGTHLLLRDGAQLVRGPQDVIELLYAHGERSGSTSSHAPLGRPAAPLEPRLAAILERVGAGEDTPDALTEEGADSGEVLWALSELELLGLLARGEGGRYVPCQCCW